MKGWHFGSDNGTGTSGESLVVWSPIHNLLYKGYELLSRSEFVYEANLDLFLGVLSSLFCKEWLFSWNVFSNKDCWRSSSVVDLTCVDRSQTISSIVFLYNLSKVVFLNNFALQLLNVARTYDLKLRKLGFLIANSVSESWNCILKPARGDRYRLNRRWSFGHIRCCRSVLRGITE